MKINSKASDSSRQSGITLDKKSKTGLGIFTGNAFYGYFRPIRAKKSPEYTILLRK
jgi:hypothetical protein